MSLLSSLIGLGTVPEAKEQEVTIAGDAGDTDVSREQFEATKASDKSDVGSSAMNLKGVTASGIKLKRPKKLKTSDMIAKPVVSGEPLKVAAKVEKDHSKLTPEEAKQFMSFFKRGR